MTPLAAAYRGRSVLVTGHTGFKGGWLALWLHRLGAQVAGIALPPEPDQPSLFAALGLEELLAAHRLLDIRDAQALAAEVGALAPEIVFHLAAQPLVRRAYADPVATWAVNVIGTAHLLEAVRRCPSVRAVIVVTSDKCYANREWPWGYREIDPLGGDDPYSASKAGTELVAAAWRRSFFPAGETAARIASVRAGNVVGGGDFAADRLIPDLVRAAALGEPLVLRNPRAVRPWQHVLEPLAGYLMLGARLLAADGDGFADAWNFGPDPADTVEVGELARRIVRAWGEGAPALRLGAAGPQPHEAGLLRLDAAKATARLGWRPKLDLDAAARLTAAWYKAWLADPAPGAMRAGTERQIDDYAARLAPVPVGRGEANGS